MCLRLFRRLIQNERGAGVVESAFALPILLVMIFGLMEVGRALFVKGMLTYSVQEGARFAGVSSAATEAAIKSRIQDNFVLIDPDNIQNFDVTFVTNSDGTRTITITLQYNHQLLIPLAFDKGLTFNDTELVYTS